MARRPSWTVLIVALAGLLVLAASFLPWYRVRWLASDNGIDSRHTNDASAWTASTQWTIAVLLAVAAAVGWPAVRSRAARWLCPILAAAAVALAVWQWRSIPGLPADPLPAGEWSASPSQGSIGNIIRDQLTVLHLEGHDRDIAWGLYAGLAAMTLLLIVLMTAAWRPGRRPYHR